MMTSVLPRLADRARTGLALCALALSALPSAADIRMSAQISYLRAGLFCAPPEAGRREAPDTVSGWTHIPDQPIEILLETLISPAILGQGFGVEFLLSDEKPLTILYEVTHPPMAPAGATRQSWSPDGPVLGGGALFFQFDEPEELMTGTWTFRALSGADEVLSVVFEVVPASMAPQLTGLCRGTMLSSLIP